MRTWKCQKCGISDTHKDDMEVELVGVKTVIAKRYHKECYKEYIKEKNFKEKEREELDHLINVIKNLYGVTVFPNGLYPFIQDLRNGNMLFGKKGSYYKEGYSYRTIADTFEYCSETIKYWNEVKSFESLSGAIKYGLAIVTDKIFIVDNLNKHKEQQNEIIKKRAEKQKEENGLEFEEFSSSYKKKKKVNDISRFLD